VNWNNPLPATTSYQGVTLPVYLDHETLDRLSQDPELCSKANWLVHIGKAVNTQPPSDERNVLEELIKKLKLARRAYSRLADCNKARIDEFSGAEVLQTMIDRATACIEQPLPKKRKLESLYWTFSTTGRSEWRKLSRADIPTQFQVFMAAVVRLVDDGTDKTIDEYIERVTKAYQRIVLGQST